MEITKEENNLLLIELTKAVSKPYLDELHEVTIEMLSVSSGRDIQACRSELEKKFNNGQLKKHIVIAGKNKIVNAYYDPARWNPK
jgi:hypothetical protein